MTSTNDKRTTKLPTGPVSRRRALLGLGGAGVATALAVTSSGRASANQEASVAGGAPIEPNAGSWKTWVLTSGDQFRLPAPNEATTESELDELEELASGRDAMALDQIAFWGCGAPSYRWNQIAVQHLLEKGVPVVRAARALALLNVAVYDATIAAWDSKYAHNRPRPAAARSTLMTAAATPNSPAYPSEHAVTAAAAAGVLSYLFPDDASTFTTLAEEAGRSRLVAGTDYPSDVEAGMELGRKVAEMVIDRASTDGSDAQWTGSAPVEPGKWFSVRPFEPMAGTWQTWVLTTADQFRPGPPPAPDSEQMAKELAEIKTFERTPLTNLTAAYWEYYGGRASYELYSTEIGLKLFEYGLEVNPPRAARAYALTQVALYDLVVATWDAKYTYWAIRPFQLDPTVTTVFPTPNHPSYPAAHASIAGAMETVLGALFPRDTEHFTHLAEDESWSRLWAGIHFRSDIEAGRTLGRNVGQAVLDWAKSDGAD
ncbi:MAG TPA: vanadium-dependent haloperoxidase [Thermomicrobiales bacterium]